MSKPIFNQIYQKPLQRLFLIVVMVFLGLFILFQLFFRLDAVSEQNLVQKNKSVTRLSKTDYAQIQEGDFILRRGYGFFSDLIATKVNQGVFDVTHVGILTSHENQWCVIHALSSEVSQQNGVQIQPLDSFLRYSQPDKIVVTRLKNVTPMQGRDIAQRAQIYSDAQIPFDSYGDIEDDNAFFCTELIWKILERDLQLIAPGTDEKSRNQRYYQLDALYDKHFFDVIVQPN